MLTRSSAPATRAQYVRAAVVGVLLHAGYLGGVFFAIDHGMPARVVGGGELAAG